MHQRESALSSPPRPHGLLTRSIVLALLLPSPVLAGSIDTDALQRPWPKQWVHEFEVGDHQVRWRQRASRTDGVFAGVGFDVPLPRQRVWALANDYSDIGRMTPGVTAVRYLERSPTRQVIQIDVTILWKTLTLTFEVEQEPPNAVRFRLVHRALGEYRGVCRFVEEVPEERIPFTSVELATQLKPSRPVPMGLLLLVERLTMLQAAKTFLERISKPTM